MEIQKIYDAYQFMAQKPQVSGAKRTGAQPAAAAKAAADSINISPEASFRAQLESAQRSYTVQAPAAASPERIAALREQYAGDCCPVATGEIAGAMLFSVTGMTY